MGHGTPCNTRVVWGMGAWWEKTPGWSSDDVTELLKVHAGGSGSGGGGPSTQPPSSLDSDCWERQEDQVPVGLVMVIK